MCNHYRNIPAAAQFLPTWREFIGFDISAELPLFAEDVWPKRKGLVLRVDDGQLLADAMRWGVPCEIPGKRPGTKIKRHVTNVRNLASPFWRSMLSDPRRRCLVPFSSFAEPVIGQGRAEHWFTIRDRQLAAFAGIWRPTKDGDAFAFLTCEPNPLVAPLHPKAMPVILTEASYRTRAAIDMRCSITKTPHHCYRGAEPWLSKVNLSLLKRPFRTHLRSLNDVRVDDMASRVSIATSRAELRHDREPGAAMHSGSFTNGPPTAFAHRRR